MSSSAPTRRQYGRANRAKIAPRRTWAEMATDLEMAVDDVLADLEEGNGIPDGLLDSLKKVSEIVRGHQRKGDDGPSDVDFSVK